MKAASLVRLASAAARPMIARSMGLRSWAKPALRTMPVWSAPRMAFSTATAAAADGDDEDEEEYDDSDERSPEDEAILDYFINLDKEEAGRTVPLAALPVKVTGTAGNLAGDLYRANAASGNFDTVIGNLYGVLETVEGASELITRFFRHNNYSEVESAIVVDLLFTNKYANYEALPTQDLRETIIGAPENYASWAEARASIKDLELLPASEDFVRHLAKIARLDLLKGVAAVCLELSTAASKIVPVTVASAIALSDAQKARVLKALPKYTNTTNFNVEFEVDPSTLGGLMITLENRSIDLSASSRLMEVTQDFQ